MENSNERLDDFRELNIQISDVSEESEEVAEVKYEG